MRVDGLQGYPMLIFDETVFAAVPAAISRCRPVCRLPAVLARWPHRFTMGGYRPIADLTNSFTCSPVGLTDRVPPLTLIHADRFAVYLSFRFIRHAKALGNAQR